MSRVVVLHYNSMQHCIPSCPYISTTMYYFNKVASHPSMSPQKKTPLSLHWMIFIFIIIFIFNHNSQAKLTQPFSENLPIDEFFDTSFRWILDLQQSQSSRIKFTFSSVISGVLCVVAASISSAGGIGGGGLFIPILSIVAGFDLKTASSLSAFMVTGGSMANVLYNTVIRSSYVDGKKGLIDYDIALLSEPCMLLGVSIGVILNRVIPEWLITILFDVFLAWSSFKTCNAGVMFWNLESEDARRKECDGESNNCDGSEGDVECVLETLLEEEEKGKMAAIPLVKIGILIMIWFSFFFVNLLRGDRYRQSVIGIKPCGVQYWIISSTQIPIAIIFTMWILCRREGCNQDQNANQQEMDVKTRCESTNKLSFPVIVTLAGVLGGTYGIGGGMLISPILLQIGIPPQVTAATCSFIVFFSSIMSAVQYLMLGMEHTCIALIYAIICFVASLTGLMVVQKVIRRHGRASLIVFSVGIVMILSTVLMTSFGAINVWKDYKTGTHMGFKQPC